jgi:Holliday junction resolvase-like predicted endonuclease
MNKRTHREYEHRKALRGAGWDVQQEDMVAFNSGSETLDHYRSKTLAAWVLKKEGYRVASEVTKDGVGEIDVIAYGTEDPPIAVECETDISDDVVRDKLERYVQNEPYRDLFVVAVDHLPAERDAALEYVRESVF